jgi:adenylate kinase
MDTYQLEYREMFHDVIRLIEDRFMPIVTRHAIPGLAVVNSEDAVFEDPLALAMVIDIFAERGYRAVVNVNRAEVPKSVDLRTGRITCATKKIFRFQIHFAGSEIRRGGG